jgi:hypothetical protein
MAAKKIKTVRMRRSIRMQALLGCPLTRNRSPWCFRICRPSPDGTGDCGRVAPHSLMSSTQLAIIRHREKQQEAGSPSRRGHCGEANA